MPERLVRVTFKKTVADGQYGVESAEISLDWFIDNANDSGTEDQAAAEEMLRQCRQMVHAELARSPNARVRQVASGTPPPSAVERAFAMATRRTVPPEPPDEGDELPWEPR